MGDIGASIVNGAFGAILHLLGLIPIGFWFVLAGAIVAIIIILRYVTDWKVVVPIIIVFFVVSEVLVWRHHWIAMGYDEAQVQVKLAQSQMQGYKQTELKIEDCYAHQGQVWDRTVGKCLNTSGAR